MKRLAVFCGSHHGDDEVFAAAARSFGELLLERRCGLVYGGGDVGLMGVIADTVMDGGGEVIGVIPEMLKDREVAHLGLTRLHVVGSMHERKALMYEMADAVVALPGGLGTFDELFEALTWNQLGLHRRPCGLLNVAGYFDPLMEMVRRAGAHGFVRRAEELLAIDDDPRRLLERLDERVASEVLTG